MAGVRRLDPQGMAIRCFLLGLFTMLSMNVRPFALLMVPGVMLIPLMTRSAVCARLASEGRRRGTGVRIRVERARHPDGIQPGALSSAAWPRWGPARGHRRHLSRQIYTHAVRFAFDLLELPDVAIPAETRARFGTLANQVISVVGADTVLPLETAGRWPGRFSYSLPEQATKFSLWGVFWIPTLVIAALLLIRNVWATWPDVRLAVVPAQSLIALPMLIAIVVGARWMADSQVPTRFLIGPYALTLPIGIAIAVSSIKGKRLAESLVADRRRRVCVPTHSPPTLRCSTTPSRRRSPNGMSIEASKSPWIWFRIGLESCSSGMEMRRTIRCFRLGDSMRTPSSHGKSSI